MYMFQNGDIDLTSFANYRQRSAAFHVVPRATNVSIHDDAVLLAPVIGFVAVPVRVPQRRTRHARYKL